MGHLGETEEMRENETLVIDLDTITEHTFDLPSTIISDSLKLKVIYDWISLLFQEYIICVNDCYIDEK